MEGLSTLETYFARFRDQIIGSEQTFDSPYGRKKILYADWTASGRAYQPIEEYLQQQILPFAANTHTGSNFTGSLISQAYLEAKTTIKRHVNAGSDDVLIFCGSGMTAAVNKLQRILGLRIPERLKDYLKNGNSSLEVDEELRPVVFVTHMEHHSNQISWLETIATVEIIGSDSCGNVDLDHFKALLQQYRHRVHKIAAVTACSNVTGIETPYHEIARIIHDHGGLSFVDFACSAPYVRINMHPEGKSTSLDAIYFSPHKFLGGPGTAGVLLFKNSLYRNKTPDCPGGGTMAYSNAWKEHRYIDDIEEREDGGTPPFLQGIKAAMCIRLKENMGTGNIRKRENELLNILFKGFKKITNATVLEGGITARLGVVSFMITGAHYSLVVKLLNDRFGIQTRGGCSCASTYGHYLLGINEADSHRILGEILSGNLQNKPGWVRLSVHPTMTNDEMHLIMNAIGQIAANHTEWGMEYRYCPARNEFYYEGASGLKRPIRQQTAV
jgi:selenocysteine lyase/cysteine desulfurase